MFNSIPVVAKAPILVLIMGNGIEPKIAIAALVCFFPTLVNSVRGLEAVNPQAIELMRVLSASRSEVFFKLRVYDALPYLFSALRIAASMSVIGAVVGEWIGATQGIGAMIIQATYNFDSPLLYAAITMSACLSGCFFMVIVALERIDHPLAARSRLIRRQIAAAFRRGALHECDNDIDSRAGARRRAWSRVPTSSSSAAGRPAWRRRSRRRATAPRPSLLERYNHLGGLASGGMVLVLDDMWDAHLHEISVRGVCLELIERLAARDLAAFPRQDEWGTPPGGDAALDALGRVRLPQPGQAASDRLRRRLRPRRLQAGLARDGRAAAASSCACTRGSRTRWSKTAASPAWSATPRAAARRSSAASSSTPPATSTSPPRPARRTSAAPTC